MDYRNFNVRTSRCSCMRLHNGGVRIHVKESALKVDSEKKIPCRTGESNLRQRRGGPTPCQLNYFPTPRKESRRGLEPTSVHLPPNAALPPGHIGSREELFGTVLFYLTSHRKLTYSYFASLILKQQQQQTQQKRQIVSLHSSKACVAHLGSN